MALPRTRLLAPQRAGPEPVNAPLFRGLIAGLADGHRAVVLDLGHACPQTVALFTPYRCRLDIADLAEGLDQLNNAADDVALAAAVTGLLPPRRAEPVDMVLCWDLLNYLRPQALRALMDQIAARGRPGTLVHFLLVYSTARMAARPRRFGTLPDGRLVPAPTGDGERDAPRYTADDLAHCLRGYRMESAMLLRNGMQELLYRL